MKTTAVATCQAGTFTSEVRNGMSMSAVDSSMDNRLTHPAPGFATAACAATWMKHGRRPGGKRSSAVPSTRSLTPWLVARRLVIPRNAHVWRRSCSVGTFDLAAQYQRRLVAGDGQAHVWLMSESGEEREVGGESCGASSRVRREFRLAEARPRRGPRRNVPEIGQVSGRPGELAEPAVGQRGRIHVGGGEWSSRSRHANSSSSQISGSFLFSMRGSTS
jgi:hypothetical protein